MRLHDSIFEIQWQYFGATVLDFFLKLQSSPHFWVIMASFLFELELTHFEATVTMLRTRKRANEATQNWETSGFSSSMILSPQKKSLPLLFNDCELFIEFVFWVFWLLALFLRFQNVSRDYHPHDLVGSFENPMHSQVSWVPLDLIVPQVSVASMKLKGIVDNVIALFSRKHLRHGAVHRFLWVLLPFKHIPTISQRKPMPLYALIDCLCCCSDHQPWSSEFCGHFSQAELGVLELLQPFSELLSLFRVFHSLIKAKCGSSQRATGFSLKYFSVSSYKSNIHSKWSNFNDTTHPTSWTQRQKSHEIQLRSQGELFYQYWLCPRREQSWRIWSRLLVFQWCFVLELAHPQKWRLL